MASSLLEVTGGGGRGHRYFNKFFVLWFDGEKMLKILVVQIRCRHDFAEKTYKYGEASMCHNQLMFLLMEIRMKALDVVYGTSRQTPFVANTTNSPGHARRPTHKVSNGIFIIATRTASPRRVAEIC